MSNPKLKKLALVMFAAFIAAILLNTPAFAADDTIYEKITPSQLITLIESLSDTAKEKGENIVIWEIDGDSISAVKISDDQTNMLFMFFDKNLKGTPEKVNKWNSEKAFSKSYLDDEGDAFLELDFSFKGGVTEANIKSFLKLCVASYRAFTKDMK
jgi:hypothetical protein